MAPAPALSQERISDSDESGSSSSSSSSGSESVAAKRSTPKQKATKALQKQPKKTQAEDKSSGGSGSSESESGSESGDESEASVEVTSAKTSEQQNGRQKNTEVLASIPAKEFKPPEGFKVQKAPSRTQDVSKIFSNLGGKQIWHITAPASVPISSIHELALETVATGESILTHKGVGYRLREDLVGLEKDKTLLLPEADGKTYHRNRTGVAQTFHIEQIVDLPNGTAFTGEEAQIERMKKPKRTQPKKLQMRYKPFGAAGGPPETIGDEEEGSEVETPAFRVPTDVAVDGESKKRKHTAVEETTPGKTKAGDEEGERKKKSKHRHSHAADDSLKDTPKDTETAQPKHVSKEKSDRGREKEKSKEKSDKKSSKKHRDETSPHKARREEKKKKKHGS